jgi:hypothetical protein
MPHLSAAPISLTPAQAEELQRLARAHKTPLKLVEHAGMILRSAVGTGVCERLRRASFASKQDLKTRIEAFITYFNHNLAKPFKRAMTRQAARGVSGPRNGVSTTGEGYWQSGIRNLP